jgi:hypothetical protein
VHTVSEQEERLLETIDVVCENAEMVELWAHALGGFTQPAPDYSSRAEYRLEGGRERVQTGPDELIHPAFWRSGITARLPLKFHKKQLLTG